MVFSSFTGFQGTVNWSPIGSREGGLSLLVPHRRYLAVFGGIWRYLAVFGGIWRYLAVFGGIWRYLAVFGGIWRYLAVFGGIWRYLAVFGGIWRYLAVFGICVFYASCQPSGCIRSSVYIRGVVIDTWILGSQKFAKYPKKKYPIVSKSIQKYQFLFLFLSINLIH